MRLHVQWIDMRGGYDSTDKWVGDVIDEETGKKVGFVEAARTPRRRHISLFSGKYQCDFDSQDKCEAFAKGVESVLNYMVENTEEQAESDEAA